jgi:hypothetical protein
MKVMVWSNFFLFKLKVIKKEKSVIISAPKARVNKFTVFGESSASSGFSVASSGAPMSWWRRYSEIFSKWNI